MSNIEKVKARVDAVLAGFEDTEYPQYFLGITHVNAEANRKLQNAIELHASGVLPEDAVRAAIREFRDASALAYTDFNIRCPEPSPVDMRRVTVIFDRPAGERISPIVTPEQRKALLAQKVIRAVEAAMADKQIISGKLKQQFETLLVTTKEKGPELLAPAVAYQNYNPYQKRLTPAPEVTLKYDVELTVSKPAEQLDPATTVYPSDAFVDNSSFEQKLAARQPVREVTQKRPVRRKAEPPTVFVAEEIRRYEPVPVTREDLPHHEDFANYCEELYARRQNEGN